MQIKQTKKKLIRFASIDGGEVKNGYQKSNIKDKNGYPVSVNFARRPTTVATSSLEIKMI
jgi:hypothetical protein